MARSRKLPVGAEVAAEAAGAVVAAGAEVAAGAWVAVAGAPQAERIIEAAMINAVKTNSFLFMVSSLLMDAIVYRLNKNWGLDWAIWPCTSSQMKLDKKQGE